MAQILNSAQKAWATRRANGNVPVAPVTNMERSPDHHLVMSVAVHTAADHGISVSCSFGFVDKVGKPVAPESLIQEDRALLSIGMVASLQPDGSFSGHERVQANLTMAHADDLAMILPVMSNLDSMLAQSREESEDSSLPMMVQALSWNRRVMVVDCDGKRTKRGPIYMTMETLISGITDLVSKAP